MLNSPNQNGRILKRNKFEFRLFDFHPRQRTPRTPTRRIGLDYLLD
jgi:hypothetical protein